MLQLLSLLLTYGLYLAGYTDHFTNDNNRRTADPSSRHRLMQCGQRRINLTLLWQRCILNQNRRRYAFSTRFKQTILDLLQTDEAHINHQGLVVPRPF